MSNYQHNKSPYLKPSMHSKFNNRQSQISGGQRGTNSRKTPPSSRGRGRGYRTSSRRGYGSNPRRGYGFVGIQQDARNGYKRHQISHNPDLHRPDIDINMSLQKNIYNESANLNADSSNVRGGSQTTKSKYRRSQIICDKIKENEIRIEGNGSMKEYVDYALELFNKNKKNKNKKKTHSSIMITATGRAISKAINCVEMVKRKKYGLHQESCIEIRKVKEIWIPIEQCLHEVIIEHDVIYVKVLLTFDIKLINNNNIGYQEPISWIDLGDARELHDKMKGKMNKLQNKYDLQEVRMNKQTIDYNDIVARFNAFVQEADCTLIKNKFNIQEIAMNKQTTDYNFNINTLQNKYDLQEEEYSDMKHKYDEQEEINDLRMDKLEDKYDVKEGQFTDMENKYDAQVEQMRENKERFDNLQNEYYKLKKHNNDRDAKLKLKKNKYDELNAKQLVDVIININTKRYLKYSDALLRKFIEEGVDGSCLNQLTKEDLYGFGITNYKDKIAIYNAIKQLFT